MLFSLWIVLKGVWYTFKYSLIVFFGIQFSGYNREDIDRIIRRWANEILDSVGLTYTTHKKTEFQMEEGKPYIIMSNHTSVLDIPLNFTAMPGSIRMLAKKELFRIPGFGMVLKKAEIILVDRQNHARAMENMKYARKKLESGIVLWVYPEGTRSRTGKLLPFKKGGFYLAIETGATIIPVSVRGMRNVMKPDSLQVQAGKSVEFYIGEPIDASQYKVEQRNKLISDVRNQIIEASGQDIA